VIGGRERNLMVEQAQKGFPENFVGFSLFKYFVLISLYMIQNSFGGA